MKKLLLLTITAILSLNLFCQVHWTKHPDNPIMVPGTAEEWDREFISPSSVVYFDGIYHMYYSGGRFLVTNRIGHATSQDGINWTKDPANPVLDFGPEGAWDESGIAEGKVLIIDSVFHMWYTGHEGLSTNTDFRIGHATSPDGVSWTKDTANPVLDMGIAGSWDESWVTAGSVVFDESKYHLWYGGYSTSTGIRFGHATSPDALTWTKDPDNPVLDVGSVGWEKPRIDYPSVIFDGTSFHMWYTGGEFLAGQIGYATSEDGTLWEKYTNNPVLPKGPDGSWDANGAIWGTVIDSAGVKYKMWYSGSQMAYTGSIGYSESRVPAWKEMKPLSSPRLTAGSCVIGQDIYIFGGWISPPPLLPDAERYNIETGETTVLQSMNKGLAFPSVDTMNHKIYVAGGFSDLNTIDNQLQQYNPDTDSWTLKKELPVNIAHHVSGVIDGKLYIAGGLQNGALQEPVASGSYVYDPETDEWDSIAPMNSTINQDVATSGRWQASSCVLDGKLYVFGGFRFHSGVAQNIGTPEVYDPNTNVWTDLAEMPLPVAHFTSVVYHDKIYLFGGSMESDYSAMTMKPTNRAFEYDPVADSWQEIKSMPFAWAFGGEGHVIDHYLYLVGGDNDEAMGGEEVGTVWRFDFESLKDYVPVWGISLDKDSLSLTAGDSKRVVVTVSPFDASDPTVSWTSGDPSIATVVNGTIKGVTGGETYVYATTVDGNLIDSCFVTVASLYISQIRFGSTGDPLNGLTVTWSSSGPFDSIAWGYSANLEEGVFEGSRRENAFGAAVFDYTFPSLTSASTIYYALFDSNDSTWTEERTFNTATDASNNQFSFTVLGDSRTYPDQWGIISEATLDTDFTLFMGDIIADGEVASDWDDWFEYGAEFIAREPVYHCIGNHDEDNSPSGFDTYLSMFNLPGNELHYSFNYGNAVFICLNSEDPGNTDQYNWLLSTLEANKGQTWKIVFFHRPFYTSPSHEGEMDAYFDTWWKAFDDYGVDMIFAGHTHNYQRTKPINRNISTTSPVEIYGNGEGDGRCQVVSGAAGAPLKDAAVPGLWWLDNSASIMHFCHIEIDGDQLTFKAIDENQVVFDELILPSTGINDFSNSNNWIYPNPANDIVTLQLSAPGEYSIEILSMNGQIIQRRSLTGSTHQIDLSSFQKGVYLISIRSKDFVTTRKIVKL